MLPAPPSEAILGTSLRSYVLAELDSALAALSARGGRIHAGIHHARKAVRRTRAVLALGAAVLGPGAALADRELRHLNHGLSALRDVHALVETLDRLAAKPHDQATTRLLHHVRRIAATRRAQYIRETQPVAHLANTKATLFMLRAGLQGVPWDAISPQVLLDALGITARSIETARAQAIADGDNEDWHRWRRRMRRMSQQRRACSAAGFNANTSLFEKSLAHQLGVMQDLSLLLEHCRQGSPFTKQDRVALRSFAKLALAKQRKRVASVGLPDAQ